MLGIVIAFFFNKKLLKMRDCSNKTSFYTSFALSFFFFPNVKEKDKQYFRLVFSIIAGSMDS